MTSPSLSAAASVEAFHPAGSNTPASGPASVTNLRKSHAPRSSLAQFEKPPPMSSSSEEAGVRDEEKRSSNPSLHSRTRVKRNWYGKKIGFITTPPSSPREHKSDLERGLEGMGERDKRPVQFYAPVYNGLAAALALGGFPLICVSTSANSLYSVHWQRN
jgi:hypothetical protein